MKAMSKEQLVQSIEENLLARVKCVTQGNYLEANEHYENHLTAWRQLRALGDEGHEALVPFLDHPHPDVRQAVGRCLLHHQTERVLAMLTHLIRSQPFVDISMADLWEEARKLCIAKGIDTTIYETAPVPPEPPTSHRGSKHTVAAQPTTVSREALMEMLQEAGLAAEAPHLVERARPSIRVRTRPAGKGALPCGASKLGGSPDVPPGFAWPKWQDEPLAFIAQFRLEEVTQYDVEQALPTSGMLYFFYEGLAFGTEEDAAGICRAVWWEGDPAQLRRARLPRDLPEEYRFTACALDFSTQLTLPPVARFWLDPVVSTEEGTAAYIDVLDQVQTLQGDDPGEEMDKHRLLGYADPLQDDVIADLLSLYMESSSEVALSRADEWRLLLQVSSDDAAGMMWDDTGRIYFCIRVDDLAARRFTEVRLVKQSM